jgi:hypothetical protein
MPRPYERDYTSRFQPWAGYPEAGLSTANNGRAAVPAGPTGELRLEIGQADVIWPAIVDELLNDKKGRRWEQLVLLKAARTMRNLAALKRAAQANVAHDLDPAQFAEIYGPEVGRAAAAEQKAFSRAFARLEGELYDVVRASRLAENALHETVGNLECDHDGDSRFVEIPDYEKMQIAEFAVSNVTTVAKSLLELHGRLHGEAVSAGTKARSA